MKKIIKKLLKKKIVLKTSYSQQGEDLILDFIFNVKGIKNPYYMDIGANHPINLSNTYYFYNKGNTGICIDPNVDYTSEYKKMRPKDLFLPIGVTNEENNTIPYYKMSWPEFNTFDKEQAEKVQEKYKGRNDIIEVINHKVVNINEVLKTHCKQRIDFLNLDIEGLDVALLKSWDFSLQTPRVICVETKDLKTGQEDEEIDIFLLSKGYSCLAKNLINSIYYID
jgi:FkbM family methyltransferase